MYYAGKKFDMFESAFDQMLEYNGCLRATQLDCIGKRNFGFVIDARTNDWFSPYIDQKNAISYIASELGVQLGCRKIKTLDELEFQKKGMVLGPLDYGVAVKGMKEYYYNGKGYYLFVEKLEEESFKVYDPLGMPGLSVRRTEMEEIIKESVPYVITCEEGSVIKREYDCNYILQEGIKYHRKVQEEEFAGFQNAEKYYQSGGGNRLTLQYGIINVCIQLDKIFALSEESGNLSDKMKREYYIYKQRLYNAGQKEDIRVLLMIWKGIWELLEYGG